MGFSRIWCDHPQAGSATELLTGICGTHSTIKWWHLISVHISFNWQCSPSEGHSTGHRYKVASGPKISLKSQIPSVYIYQNNFLDTEHIQTKGGCCLIYLTAVEFWSLLRLFIDEYSFFYYSAFLQSKLSLVASQLPKSWMPYSQLHFLTNTTM